MADTEVTAVIPVYNDRDALEIALPRSIEVLDRISSRFEIIVAEDGSTDGSPELVQGFSHTDRRVRLLHSDKRLGRGLALHRAITEAQGSIVCYFDVDLATDMQHLEELIQSIRSGADVATGSRLLPRSDTRRTRRRQIASRGYNFLVRLILGSRVHDHQCGFKAFRKERILPILPLIQAGHWFWDTELLIRCQRIGYRITELPVRWRPGKGTTVKLKDVFEMGSSILELWWQLNVP